MFPKVKEISKRRHFDDIDDIGVCKNGPKEAYSRALSVREFLATKLITVLGHPAYSLDLANRDFFLFPNIKEILKGRHFDDSDDIRSNVMAALKAIPQNQFQNCFERWTRCWHRCIASQGEYFEGDHGGFQQRSMEHIYRDEFAKFNVIPRKGKILPW
jgi:hypothetical protein